MQKSPFIFLFVLLGLYSCAQKLAITKKENLKKEAVAPLQLEHTLLWEITGKDMAQPSYLFGTMHLLCADDAKLSDSLRYAIENAKQVYFEIDLDNFMETLGAMQYLNMNNNTRLADLLTTEEYQRVKDYFKKNKTMLPLSMMERLKPYFITSLISESKFPCAAKDGMEQVIMKEAKKDSKPIKGLETVQFQASVFDSIPYQRQAKDLLKMIDSAGSGADDSDVKLIEIYRSQDLNKMQEITAAEEGMAEFLDLLLYNRNANWAQKMPLIMKEKQSLFAVGAGHLGGDKGVINLLRKTGYKVRPMKHLPGLLSESNQALQ
jgi:uncharacterized protein